MSSLLFLFWGVGVYSESERGRKGRREEGRRKRETSMWETSIGALLVCALTRGRTHNLGMCPDQESNLQSFGPRDDAPTNWATTVQG